MAIMAGCVGISSCKNDGYRECCRKSYYDFTSDDGKNKILAADRAWLLSGWGEVYEKTSFCTMKKVGEFGTNDGYRLFTHSEPGEYYFVWNEDNFELYSRFIFHPEDGVVVMNYVK